MVARRVRRATLRATEKQNSATAVDSADALADQLQPVEQVPRALPQRRPQHQHPAEEVAMKARTPRARPPRGHQQSALEMAKKARAPRAHPPRDSQCLQTAV